MSENTELRISLNLFNFYHDFRQLSRIFINEDIKNIADLQNFIKESFGIEKPFYLQSLNYYLPPNQDIRVLKYDDPVYVIPINDEEHFEIIPKKRKRKHSVEKVDDTCNEIVKSKKKNKKKDLKPIEETPQIHSEKRKKRKRKKSTSDEEHDFEINVESTIHSTGIKTKDKNTVKVIREENIPKSNPISTVAGKTLQLNEMMDFNVIKSKKNILNIDQFIKSVNKNNDTSSKTLVPHTSNSSELIKNVSVNSDINSFNKSDTRNLNLSVTKIGSCDNFVLTSQKTNSKNNVNNNISAKNISVLNKSDCKVTNNTYGAQREWYKTSFMKPTQPNNNSESNNEVINSLIQNNTQNLDLSSTKIGSWDDTTFKTPESVRNYKKSMLNSTKNLQLSTTKIGSWDDNSFLSNGNNNESRVDEHIIDDSLTTEENGEKSQISSFSSENDSKNINSETVIPDSEKQSMDCNLKKINSLSFIVDRISQENREKESFSTLAENITKRRTRVRKRHRKSKSITETPEIQPENKVYIPPKTIAAPKIHKKFSEDDSSDYVDSPDLSKLSDSILECSSPYMVNTKHLPEMSVISEEYKNETLERLFKESNNLLSKPPNVNEKILFKKLKLNEEYTPVESGLILATVSYISDDKKCLELQIIAGHQELKDPVGKFSILVEENEEIEEENDTSVAYVEWNELIQPKLIE